MSGGIDSAYQTATTMASSAWEKAQAHPATQSLAEKVAPICQAIGDKVGPHYVAVSEKCDAGRQTLIQKTDGTPIAPAVIALCGNSQSSVQARWLIFLIFLGVLVFRGDEDDINSVGGFQIKDQHLKGAKLLRIDWLNRRKQLMAKNRYQSSSLVSPLAKRYIQLQNNCSLPLADFRFRNEYGVNSDFHLWTQAMCNALQDGVRIRTELPWMHIETEYCNKILHNQPSALSCYFPHVELQCPEQDVVQVKLDDNGTQPLKKLHIGTGWVAPDGCKEIKAEMNLTIPDVRAAGMEFLFLQPSPAIVAQAVHMLQQIFSSTGGVTPTNLIMVQFHKIANGNFVVPMEQYVKAVDDLVNKPSTHLGRQHKQKKGVHIFLSTIFSDAVELFGQVALERNWNIYVYEHLKAYVPSDRDRNRQRQRRARSLQDIPPPHTAAEKASVHEASLTKGPAAMNLIASMMVALQANDYVLTTYSNLDRAVNELRKNVIDPSCGGCTRMVDLKAGEW